jgi:ketosteroid isomerase-like protein
MTTNQKLIQKFWQKISDQKWDEVKGLLHPDFVAVWPQSKEKMIGGENFVNVNKFYPGNHRVDLVHIHEAGSTVFTTVWIVADTGQKTFACSYFEVKDGKILKAEEYWAEPYAAPEWRKPWVELIP